MMKINDSLIDKIRAESIWHEPFKADIILREDAEEIIRQHTEPQGDDHNCRYREALDVAHRVFAAECDKMQAAIAAMGDGGGDTSCRVVDQLGRSQGRGLISSVPEAVGSIPTDLAPTNIASEISSLKDFRFDTSEYAILNDGVKRCVECGRLRTTEPVSIEVGARAIAAEENYKAKAIACAQAWGLPYVD